MTHVTMTKQELDSLTDERLGWMCAEPTFLRIRGKDLSVKAAVLGGLTPGQRALCMFRVLFDHAKHSPEEFYGWLAQLQATPSYRDGVASGLRFFGDDSMAKLVDEATTLIERRNRELGLSWKDVTVPDLSKDAALRSALNTFYHRFLETAEQSHQRIGTYIRTHPEEFVHVV